MVLELPETCLRFRFGPQIHLLNLKNRHLLFFLSDEYIEVGFSDTEPEMGDFGEIYDIKACHDCVLQIANFRDSGGSDTGFSVGLDTEFQKVEEAHDIGVFSHGIKGGVTNTLLSVDQILAPV